MISTLDIAIILIYLFFMLGFGFFLGRTNKNQDDYFLANRSMPWIPVALSIAATLFSANGIVGGPGWAYQDGLKPFMLNITVPLAVFLSMWITTPVLYHLRVVSVYEFMELRLGKKTRLLTIMQFLINSFIQASSMIYIPSMIIEMMTGWPIQYIAIFVVIVAIIFTLIGGIKAVIWTDSIQIFVIIGGVSLIIYTALQGIGIPLSEIFTLAKNHGKLNAFDFSTDLTKANTFWATLFGASFMWIRYFCFDQSQVQKILSSRSIHNTKSSLITSAIIMNTVYFLMLTVGIVLFVFYQGKPFPNANQIVLNFIFDKLPTGITGLVIAGIIVEAITSAESLLNSMTAVFTKDIYYYYFKKDSDETSLRVAQLMAFVLGIVMILFVILGFSKSTSSLLNIVGGYISYFSGPAAGAFLLAFFTTRANDSGVAVGAILSLILVITVQVLCSISWLWNPAIGALSTLILGYGLSFCFVSEKKSHDTYPYTAFGIRSKIKAAKAQGQAQDELPPFTFGKKEAFLLIFFACQYLFLTFLQYS